MTHSGEQRPVALPLSPIDDVQPLPSSSKPTYCLYHQVLTSAAPNPAVSKATLEWPLHAICYGKYLLTVDSGILFGGQLKVHQQQQGFVLWGLYTTTVLCMYITRIYLPAALLRSYEFRHLLFLGHIKCITEGAACTHN